MAHHLRFFLFSFQPHPFLLSFDRLSRNTGLLTLEDLRALPELQGNPFVPMVFDFLRREAGKKEEEEREARTKKGGSGGLGVVEFGRALESFCLDGGAGGERDEAVFRVLDSDGDGKLSLDELEAALRPLLLSSEEKEKASGGIPPALVAGAALQKHDGDGDGGLSPSDFRSLLAAAGGGGGGR